MCFKLGIGENNYFLFIRYIDFLNFFKVIIRSRIVVLVYFFRDLFCGIVVVIGLRRECFLLISV